MALKAGAICGNPLTGLCQRTVIETRQVYDGCVLRLQNENVILSLSDFTLGSIPPYTYLRAENSGNSTISNLSVTPLEGRRNKVSLDITCPCTVYFNDTNGNPGTARGNYIARRDVVLEIPEPSLAFYSIEAATALISTLGTFMTNTTVNITCCIVQTIKVIVTVDLLIPSYCYASYPACTDPGDTLCRGMFNLPLFPTNRF